MMYLGILIRLRFCRFFIYVFYLSYFFVGRGLFYLRFFWYIVCSICFLVKVKGERNFNGLNIDVMMESILCCVGDVFWLIILK